MGKRLAKISKEAKERKREAQREANQEFDQSERSLADLSGYVDFRYIVGGVTIVAALGGLYYAYKGDKRLAQQADERSESKRSERLKDSSEVQKVKTINKNDYDRPEVSAAKLQITKCNPPTTQTACSFAAESEGRSRSCIENL